MTSALLSNLPDTKAFKVVSNLFLELICHYFRVEIKGLDRIPKKGAAIIIPNHSGYAGFDALVLAHLIRTLTRRAPRIMAHRAYFEWMSWLRNWSFALGLREARLSSALKTLRHKHLLIVFPEGEAGNFKSSLKRYQLQPFHSGFTQLALRSKTKVIPCIIIGAEESHLNLGSIQLKKVFKGLSIPFPINFFPLPTKWRIEFLDPLDISEMFSTQKRCRKNVKQFSERVQKQLQVAIQERLLKREHICY